MNEFASEGQYIETLKAIKEVNKYRKSGLTPDEVCEMATSWKRFSKIFCLVDELGGSEVLENLVSVKRKAKEEYAEQAMMDAAKKLYAERFKREGITVEQG